MRRVGSASTDCARSSRPRQCRCSRSAASASIDSRTSRRRAHRASQRSVCLRAVRSATSSQRRVGYLTARKPIPNIGAGFRVMAPAERPGGFGSKLREARERKGVSLRQIANQTKISVAALEALERNDISRLPGGIFSRAFVRSYAVEVGLDPETTIQEFIAQFPHDSVTAGHPTSDQSDDNDTLQTDRRAASTALSILAISIPFAGAVVYFTMTNRGT